MRPLGKNQKSVIDALRRHHSFHPGCGWIYANYSTTVKILESLAQRGIVAKLEKPNFTTYTLKGKP